MPVNPIFNHYGSPSEQSILDQLTAESIQINGIDMLYMPRHIFNENLTFTEDPQSYFTDAIPIELYIKNVESFEGDGNFLSKFGLEIRDQIVLVVAKSRFQTLIGDPYALSRPREGDLIYFPLNKKIFEIRFVDPFAMFYPLGSTFTYELKCELYEYSSQKFDTGVADIDDIENFSEDLFRWSINTEDGFAIMTEDGNVLTVDNYDPESIMSMDDDDDIRKRADTFMDISETNPYGTPES
jgi:hypothetical protein